MNRKVELKALGVVLARDTEIHKGWVRLSEDSRGGIPSGRYVRLAHGGRKIHCQLRGQLEGTPEKDCVEMSEYYRDKLSLAPGEVFGIEIEEVGQCGRLRALFNHPDDTVQVAMYLGAIGVGLGAIGLVLGLIGLTF